LAVPKDLVSETRALIDATSAKNMVARCLGAIAFRIHCPTYEKLFEKMGREITDIDIITYSKHRKTIGDVLRSFGYQKEERYSLVVTRDIFHNAEGNVHLDLFFDKIQMCHTLDLSRRLEKDYPTIPLADMVLEKAQIVKINDKDINDLIVLFLEHAVEENDNETINSKYISDIMSNDWGFYHTCTTNLRKVKEKLANYSLPGLNTNHARSRIEKLLERIDKTPKSRRWKLRARIGTRKKWYKDVDEIIR
jgi:hypothetical protein